MDLTLAQALETAEREYLCARVENLLQRADNPYGARVFQHQGMACFHVKGCASPMFNRVYADPALAPDTTVALLKADAEGTSVWPHIAKTAAFAPRLSVGEDQLERLKGWTHLQLSCPLEQAITHPHGFIIETVSAGDLSEFAAVHAAGFRADPARAAVNQASFSGLVANERLTLYVAWLDGERVAGAALYSASNGIAYLGTAATCKHARGQGLHQALITHRIEQARAMGCQRVAATTLANAQSRRNLQRAGLIVSHAQALYRLAHP